ncbi:MAG TPA: maltose alpha-D-glucosyltransferase [Polyangiaceae bacterium]
MSERDWYKDAIVYELRVRSFYDSNGDGIGDLSGLTAKLDYLKDLGVTAIWLLPLYPSPFKDDGYDIADYFSIDRSVGDLDDFRRLLDEAHARDLRVITELVLNHTSDAHPWFQRARRAPAGSPHRDYYVWSDDPERWSQTRIIFQDFETSNWTWDPVARAYYWHRFFSHQPDLNFESPDVERAMLSVVDHWFGMGVDGMRLDAVPYLYEREGTTSENLPETHAFLKRLRAHIDQKFPGRMLLAEANQWPEDAAAYFGAGDECHMAFHFPLMPRLFLGLRMEDSYPIADILEQTPSIPEVCQWAVFLRNHDELTLEMVTDEERDYMVQRYATDQQTRINLGIRRRLAPLLDNDRRRIELLNALLLSIPGTPVLYYGDEIGMGDNAYLRDRNGVRTPMQWSPDRNGGFSNANPQKLVLPTILDPEYRFETVNVEVQEANPSSLLWWMKRMLGLRKRHPAFARGSLTLLAPENRKVLSFLRRHGAETLLVVVNLSRTPQWVELELSEFRGVCPLELFGTVSFPAIGETPYRLTLGAHGVFWFSLTRTPERLTAAAAPEPALTTPVATLSPEWVWQSVPLALSLARYVPRRRWFRSKTRQVTRTRVLDTIALPEPAADVRLVFTEVGYDEGEPEIYALMLTLERTELPPASAVMGLRPADAAAVEAWVVDASELGRTAQALHAFVLGERRARGEDFELTGLRAPGLDPDEPVPSARVISGEQSNTSYSLGQRFVGKLLRKLEPGPNLEVEVLEHLARSPVKANVARVLGRIDVDLGRGEPAALFLSESYLDNEGDAWQLSVDAVQSFYERVLATPPEGPLEHPAPSLVRAAALPFPERVERLLADYLPLARLLGQRTAELHRALAHDPRHPLFAPRVFDELARRSAYQALRNLLARTFDKLRKAELTEPALSLKARVFEHRTVLRARVDRLLSAGIGGRLIRVHGDFHLGQVLYSGRDFSIIDFEGEPARTRGERRRLRSPLADIAGMLRSFHYAAHGVLTGELAGSRVRAEDRGKLEPIARFHYAWSAAAFLSSYLKALEDSLLLPSSTAEIERMLDVHLIEKALSEIGYELDTRPGWVALPLGGLCDLLEAEPHA